jgi:hypothetical protein
MSQHVPEQVETLAASVEEVVYEGTVHEADVQELTGQPVRSDLITSIVSGFSLESFRHSPFKQDSLVETLCNMRSQVDELQNERDEYFRALQTAQEELQTYKETVGKVMVALGYGE